MGAQAFLVTNPEGARALADNVGVRTFPVFADSAVTAVELTRLGFKQVHAANDDSADLARLVERTLKPVNGAVVYACNTAPSIQLSTMLGNMGFAVRPLPLYATKRITVMPVALRSALEDGGVEAALFLTPDEARAFVAMIQQEKLEGRVQKLPTVAANPVVAAPLRALKLGGVAVPAAGDPDSVFGAFNTRLIDKVEEDRRERERRAAEEAERKRVEEERLAQEQQERERQRQEAEDKARAEAERIAREKADAERAAREKAEQDRLAREKAAQEEAERRRLQREAEEQAREAQRRAEHERAEQKRLEKEKIARENAEAERIAKEKAAAEKAEHQRLAAEEAERKRVEKARLAAGKAGEDRKERERRAAERAEAERIARQKAEQERLERERRAQEKTEHDRQERERRAREQAHFDAVAFEEAERKRAEDERRARTFAEQQRIEAERLATERAEKKRAEEERAAQARAERERIAAERAEEERSAREKAAAEKAERRRLAEEEAERRRIEKTRLAEERAERDREERARAEEARAERERLARIAAEEKRAEKERLSRERAEAERIAKEKAAAEKAERKRLAAEETERKRAEKARLAAERAARRAEAPPGPGLVERVRTWFSPAPQPRQTSALDMAIGTEAATRAPEPPLELPVELPVLAAETPSDTMAATAVVPEVFRPETPLEPPEFKPLGPQPKEDSTVPPSSPPQAEPLETPASAVPETEETAAPAPRGGGRAARLLAEDAADERAEGQRFRHFNIRDERTETEDGDSAPTQAVARQGGVLRPAALFAVLALVAVGIVASASWWVPRVTQVVRGSPSSQPVSAPVAEAPVQAPVQTNAPASDLAALVARVAVLEQRSAAVTPEAFAALQQQLTQHLARPDGQPAGTEAVTSMGDSLASQARQLAAVTARIATLEAAIGNVARLEDISRQLKVLEAKSAEANSVLALSDRVTALETTARQAVVAHTANIALLLAVAQWRDAVGAGRPFMLELETVKSVAARTASPSVDDASFSQHAARGLPTLAELQRRFGETAAAVIRADALPKAGASWINRAAERLLAIVTIRRADGEEAGDGVSAILARAERRLMNGDLAAAVQEMNGLKEDAASAAMLWLEPARARVAAEKSMTEATNRAVAALAASPADTPAKAE